MAGDAYFALVRPLAGWWAEAFRAMISGLIRGSLLALGLSAAGLTSAGAQAFTEFSTQGLPRSQGIVVRVSHPAGWSRVPTDDEMAVAELRGLQGKLTGILQIGRGRHRNDTDALCPPERARTMLQDINAQNPDVFVTDVFARQHEGRPAYEIGYQRNVTSTYLAVRSLIVCLKGSQVVVSCAGAGENRTALAEIGPVCKKVLDSLSIAEE